MPLSQTRTFPGISAIWRRGRWDIQIQGSWEEDQEKEEEKEDEKEKEKKEEEILHELCWQIWGDFTSVYSTCNLINIKTGPCSNAIFASLTMAIMCHVCLSVYLYTWVHAVPTTHHFQLQVKQGIIRAKLGRVAVTIYNKKSISQSQTQC